MLPKQRKLTNVERIMLLLRKERRLNTRQIAIRMVKSYIYIRNLLYDMKRRKLVDCEMVRRFYPGVAWILVNEWFLTKEGEKWLKERGL